jgi:hypothetical protein
MSLPADEIRFEVRRHLAAWPSSALPEESILHKLRFKGLEIEARELTDALTYMADLQPPQVKRIKNSLNTHRWQITTAGVIAYENNE